jgi:hypothetical protein
MSSVAGMMTGISDNGTCGYCGMGHIGTCPRVKAIEYHENGTLKRVEFHAPAVPEGMKTIVVPSQWQTTMPPEHPGNVK